MERHADSLEFDAGINDEGKIEIPSEILHRVKNDIGELVHVRLSDVHEAATLRARGISEDEVDGIAQLQIESRVQVIKFLLSEGALAQGNKGTGKKR